MSKSTILSLIAVVVCCVLVIGCGKDFKDFKDFTEADLILIHPTMKESEVYELLGEPSQSTEWNSQPSEYYSRKELRIGKTLRWSERANIVEVYIRVSKKEGVEEFRSSIKKDDGSFRITHWAKGTRMWSPLVK